MMNGAPFYVRALGPLTHWCAGISQMTLILPQAISPALGNSLFAASIYDNILGGNLIWVVMLAMSKFSCTIAPNFRLTSVLSATIAWVHSLTLHAPTHDWRQNVDRDDDEE